MRNSNQILHDDQTRWDESSEVVGLVTADAADEKYFYKLGYVRSLPWPKIFVTQMLTRDMFAVAIAFLSRDSVTSKDNKVEYRTVERNSDKLFSRYSN